MDRVKVFPTAEHFFQSFKTRDSALQKEIRLADFPGAARQLGQKVPLRDDWDRIKYLVMTFVIHKKFGDDLKLLKRLYATEERPLIEGNYWHDNYWGNCYCPRCRKIKGQNKLGKILMQTRVALAWRIDD